MTGVLSTGNDGTSLLVGEVANVVMPKLQEHEVARLETVVDALPTTVVKILTGAATRDGLIADSDLRGVKDGLGQRAPAPHARAVGLVFILHGGVATDKHHRFASFALEIDHRQGHTNHHLLQRFEQRMG